MNCGFGRRRSRRWACSTGFIARLFSQIFSRFSNQYWRRRMGGGGLFKANAVNEEEEEEEEEEGLFKADAVN